MKTGVIVTNRYLSNPTPIIRCSAYSGRVEVFNNSGHLYFVIDFKTTSILSKGGLQTRMTKEEAVQFDADFGIWFSS